MSPFTPINTQPKLLFLFTSHSVFEEQFSLTIDQRFPSTSTATHNSAMAQIRTSMATVLFGLFAIFSAAVMVSAQEAPAPSPSSETGAGVALPISAAILSSSLLMSFFALFKH
ncbi:hypothetical protein NE237_010550 [Protea cynaroides]|uniref:Uncharacterized protein n=1 Tax=Protea cynaroides TaxID=273540 RepID=A0A9Q0R1S5_9MAGN|nr:hypothetical protein NE237_010550 [Protea cynaroides]